MLHFEYKGYTAQADFNDPNACYEGQVTNSQDLIRFRGYSPTDSQRAFQYGVDLYFEVCHKRGVPPKPSRPAHSCFLQGRCDYLLSVLEAVAV